MSSNSVVSVCVQATVKLKMKTLPTGVPVALCRTAIQFSDSHGNRSFLLVRIAVLVVDAVDVLDVSVSEIAAFPPSVHLAFSSVVSMHRQILVVVQEAFGAHQHSSEPILCSAKDFRYPSCAYHLARIVGWPPCFGCIAFLSILPLEKHHLSSSCTVF